MEDYLIYAAGAGVGYLMWEKFWKKDDESTNEQTGGGEKEEHEYHHLLLSDEKNQNVDPNLELREGGIDLSNVACADWPDRYSYDDEPVELYSNKDGKNLTIGPSTYKIPGSRDIPLEFKVRLLKNSPNEEKTIFRSKAVGEPPLLLAISQFLAIKNAIENCGKKSNTSTLNSPITPMELLKVFNQ